MRKISWLFQTMILVLAACNTTPELDPGSPSTITLPDGTIINTCNTVHWQFNAGGSPSRSTGSVVVSNDHSNLYIQVHSDYGFQEVADNIKVAIVTELDLIPTDKEDFKWKASCKKIDKDYTFIIPFADIESFGKKADCTSAFYIFVHGEVFVDEYNTPDYASGGNTCGRVANCGCHCYGVYQSKCCDAPEPPAHGSTETAFAKGNYVFTSDDKSNPEHLPSLNLSKNRWGWAINLKTTGHTTYPIYAGAGLNDITKGVEVGTLTVDWNGAAATIKYETTSPYWLSTVHIYGGDYKPTTTAPGLFGHTAEFNPKVHTYTKTIAVADTDHDGIWIIAHAGVYGSF